MRRSLQLAIEMIWAIALKHNDGSHWYDAAEQLRGISLFISLSVNDAWTFYPGNPFLTAEEINKAHKEMNEDDSDLETLINIAWNTYLDLKYPLARSA